MLNLNAWPRDVYSAMRYFVSELPRSGWCFEYIREWLLIVCGSALFFPFHVYCLRPLINQANSTMITTLVMFKKGKTEKLPNSTSGVPLLICD